MVSIESEDLATAERFSSKRLDDGMSAFSARHPKPDTSLRAVREAYRETVMAVPHLEAEYDDSLEANLSMEFGPELGTQIATGTRLTAQLYEALLTASEGARDEREMMLPALERERESLQSVQATLDDCERRQLHSVRTHAAQPTRRGSTPSTTSLLKLKLTVRRRQRPANSNSTAGRPPLSPVLTGPVSFGISTTAVR